MSEERIRSGRTKRVEATISTLFEESVEDFIEVYKSAQMTQWRVNAKKTWQVIGGKSYVPVNAYLVRYMLAVFEVTDITPETIIRLLNSADSYTDADEKVKHLVDMMFDEFERNGCGIEKGVSVRGSVLKRMPVRGKKGQSSTVAWDRNSLFLKLKAETLTADEMYAIAFGVSMDYNDLVMFLKKALKRADFNLLNQNEFLLYLTFRYVKSNNIISFYEQLKDTYEKISPRSLSIVGRTEEILADSDVRGRHFELGQDGQIHEDIKEILADYKNYIAGKNDYDGSASDLAAQLLETLKEQCASDLVSNKAEKDINFAKGFVTIFYDPARGLDIPAGTEFYKRGSDTKKKPVAFVTDEDVTILPGSGEDYSEIVLEVECAVSEPKVSEAENHIGYVPKNSVFRVDEKVCPFLSCIHNKSYFKPDKNDPVGKMINLSGKVYARCVPGNVVEPGTVLFYDNGSTATQFIVTRAVDSRVSVDIPVTAAKSEEEATKNQINDCSIKGWKNIFSIENKKISLKEKGRAGSRGALYPYLYSSAGNPEIIKGKNADKYFEKLGRVLKGTRLENDKLSNIKNHREQGITRSDILTLTFLVYVTEDPDLFGDIEDMLDIATRTEISSFARRNLSARQIAEENSRLAKKAARAEKEARETYDMLLAEFRRQANDNLRRCGFYELYLPNPYDGLLALLLASESPINAFRELWGTYGIWQSK